MPAPFFVAFPEYVRRQKTPLARYRNGIRLVLLSKFSLRHTLSLKICTAKQTKRVCESECTMHIANTYDIHSMLSLTFKHIPHTRANWCIDPTSNHYILFIIHCYYWCIIVVCTLHSVGYRRLNDECCSFTWSIDDNEIISRFFSLLVSFSLLEIRLANRDFVALPASTRK